MIRPIITLRRKRVLIDVDTQKDFFLADGRACVFNHRRILANIRRVCAWARLKNVRMISTCRINCPTDVENQFCTDGTEGIEKLSYSLRDKHITFNADGCTDLPRDILQKYDQVIVYKRCPDPFNEPRADRILSELKATEFIVFGATTEQAIKKTVLGLLARRKNVTVLQDTIGCIDRSAAEIALRQCEAKGAQLVDTKQVLGNTHLQLVGACSCDRCRGKLQKAPMGYTE